MLFTHTRLQEKHHSFTYLLKLLLIQVVRYAPVMASIVFNDKDIVIKSVGETHSINITSYMDSSQKPFIITSPVLKQVQSHSIFLY